jgi:hypothetical protein
MSELRERHIAREARERRCARTNGSDAASSSRHHAINGEYDNNGYNYNNGGYDHGDYGNGGYAGYGNGQGRNGYSYWCEEI